MRPADRPRVPDPGLGFSGGQVPIHAANLAIDAGAPFRQTLVELATQVGLNPDEVRQALTEGEFATAVQEDIDQARAYGITGVPFFVIQNKYGISGAQDSAVLLSAMQQANSEN